LVTVHAIVGLLTLVVAALLLIWNAIRLSSGSTTRKSFYRILVGLLDLQLLLGIITFVIHPKGGIWLLHPILMIAAVAVAHVFTKDTRSKAQQLTGYVAVLVLILLGVWLGNVLP
jgi:heme A synthase